MPPPPFSIRRNLYLKTAHESWCIWNDDLLHKQLTSLKSELSNCLSVLWWSLVLRKKRQFFFFMIIDVYHVRLHAVLWTCSGACAKKDQLLNLGAWCECQMDANENLRRIQLASMETSLLWYSKQHS